MRWWVMQFGQSSYCRTVLMNQTQLTLTTLTYCNILVPCRCLNFILLVDRSHNIHHMALVGGNYTARGQPRVQQSQELLFLPPQPFGIWVNPSCTLPSLSPTPHQCQIKIHPFDIAAQIILTCNMGCLCLIDCTGSLETCWKPKACHNYAGLCIWAISSTAAHYCQRCSVVMIKV